LPRVYNNLGQAKIAFIWNTHNIYWKYLSI